MLLLFFAGASGGAPPVVSVRAYGNISYALVGSASLSFALTTNAYATEE